MIVRYYRFLMQHLQEKIEFSPLPKRKPHEDYFDLLMTELYPIATQESEFAHKFLDHYLLGPKEKKRALWRKPLDSLADKLLLAIQFNAVYKACDQLQLTSETNRKKPCLFFAKNILTGDLEDLPQTSPQKRLCVNALPLCILLITQS